MKNRGPFLLTLFVLAVSALALPVVWKSVAPALALHGPPALNAAIGGPLSVLGVVCASALLAYLAAQVGLLERALIFAAAIAVMFSASPLIGLPAGLALGVNVWLLEGVFRSFPREMGDAARLDGCGEWGVFWRVILPPARPALALMTLFTGAVAWHELEPPAVAQNWPLLAPVDVAISVVLVVAALNVRPRAWRRAS